jgi:dTDP-4-dehydrorhamnose 3,5-epimerase
MLLIPPGFGSSFYVMSETAVVNYKWAYPGKYPDVEDQFTVKWNDPEIGVHWPTTNPILSERDA